MNSLQLNDIHINFVQMLFRIYINVLRNNLLGANLRRSLFIMNMLQCMNVAVMELVACQQT